FYGVEAGAHVVGGEGSAGAVFAAQQAAGQRHAGQEAEAVAFGGGEIHFFRAAIQAVIYNLQGLDGETPGFARLHFAPLAQNRNAQVADSPRPLLLQQRAPQIPILKSRVGTGVELVEIDALDPQGAQRRFELAANLGGAEGVIPVHEGAEMVAEFCGDDPAGTVVAGEVIADEFFGGVIAVAFGGVDEVDAGVGGGVEDGVGLILGKDAAPFTAQLPGAHPDDGQTQSSFAKNAVAHNNGGDDRGESQTNARAFRRAHLNS